MVKPGGADASRVSSTAASRLCRSRVGKENAGALPRCRTVPTFGDGGVSSLVERVLAPAQNVGKDGAATGHVPVPNPRVRLTSSSVHQTGAIQPSLIGEPLDGRRSNRITSGGNRYPANVDGPIWVSGQPRRRFIRTGSPHSEGSANATVPPNVRGVRSLGMLYPGSARPSRLGLAASIDRGDDPVADPAQDVDELGRLFDGEVDVDPCQL